MPDIEVNCGNCGNAFTVVEELAGLIATCPHCGRQISVPLPPDRRAGAPRLQMLHEASATGGKRCPSCSAAMADDAVLCVECGFDLRQKAPALGFRPPSGTTQTLLTIAGVIIMVGLVWALFQRVYPGRRQDTAPVTPPAAAAPEAAPVAPAAASAEGVASVDTQALAAAATSEVPAVAAAALEDAAARAKMEVEYRAALRKELDAKYPMYGRGASIAVRRVNGQVHRGVMTDLRKDVVVLVMPGGVVVEVPFQALDGASRLRCDRAFRDRYMDALAKRHIQALSRP